MTGKEAFTENLKTFGGLFLQGFDNDFDRAANALGLTVKFMAENEGVIPFLANESNQAVLGEMIDLMNSNKKKDALSLIGAIGKMTKKLKF